MSDQKTIDSKTIFDKVEMMLKKIVESLDLNNPRDYFFVQYTQYVFIRNDRIGELACFSPDHFHSIYDSQSIEFSNDGKTNFSIESWKGFWDTHYVTNREQATNHIKDDSVKKSFIDSQRGYRISDTIFTLHQYIPNFEPRDFKGEVWLRGRVSSIYAGPE